VSLTNPLMTSQFEEMGTSQVVEMVPPGYLPLADVVRELGKSDSTVERLVAAQALRWQWAPRIGKKPARVYLAEDVERLKREEEGRKAARPPSALVVRPKPETDPLMQAMLTILDRVTKPAQLEAPAPAPPEPPPLVAKLWLTIEEAQACGLSYHRLLKMCKERKVVAIKDGSWKIFKPSLQAFAG
jgi:hypothetical protein